MITDDCSVTNRWLPEGSLPGFRDNANQLFRECWNVSARVLRAVALGLNLDEDDLLRYHSSEHSTLAFRHYPSIEAEKVKALGFERMGTHRDYTPSITLLLQDNEGGLEVQRPEGFVAVPPIKDTLVMNIRDVLMHWTNGTFFQSSFKSTL